MPSRQLSRIAPNKTFAPEVQRQFERQTIPFINKIMIENFQQKRVCRHCSYDANSYNASHCEVCNRPLKSISATSKNNLFTTSFWSYIPLGGLLLVTTGFFLFWLLSKNYTFSENPTSSSLLIRKNATQPPANQQPATPQPTTTAVSKPVAGKIQLFNSMLEVQNVPSGIFNYSGAHTFAAISAIANKAIAQSHPKFRLRYTEPFNNKPGSGTGIAMLLDGQLSFSHSGRPLKDDEYAKAKARSFRLEQIPIALDAIAFYTHPKMNLPGLSIQQVQAIFLGKITNWKQIGGPNLPIKAFAVDPKLTSAIQILFGSNDDIKLGLNVQILRDYTEIIRKVATIPGTISYASAPLIRGQKSIRPLALAKGNSRQYVTPFLVGDVVNEEAIRDGSYPLSRRLFLVLRRDGTLDEQGGIAYANLLLSQQGQQVIEQAGFVPLR